MKIIFNHYLDWYWQIYNEWSRNNTILIPENYRKRDPSKATLNLDSLAKIIDNSPDADFIFGFQGDLYDLIKWRQFHIDIPIVIFATNAIERPNNPKRSVFAILWYVEKYAQPLMEKFDINNLIYMGMAANPYIFYPINKEKVYEVSFFGKHYGERGYWLKNLKEFCTKNQFRFKFPLGHGSKLFWSFEDINYLYNQSKINISFAPKEPPGRIVNLRTFEICMSGGFQLMQYTPCVDEYFEIDSEIVCWKNKKELHEKIKYFLENEKERKKIARKGFERAKRDHTWSNRLESIQSYLNNRPISNPKDQIVKLSYKFHKPINNIEVPPLQKDIDEFVYQILLNLNYNLKSQVKKYSSLRIKLDKKAFYYKPQGLDKCYFIEINGKKMLVLKILTKNTGLNSYEWEKLEKIIYLTENLDKSLPQFGVLMNKSQYIVYDFKNRRWLNRIPNKDQLKNLADVYSYVILKILKSSKKILNKSDLGTIITNKFERSLIKIKTLMSRILEIKY